MTEDRQQLDKEERIALAILCALISTPRRAYETSDQVTLVRQAFQYADIFLEISSQRHKEGDPE
jgi:hypothetical protein